MAEDFTVALKVPPYLENTKDLKAIYWGWAQRVLEKQRSIKEGDLKVKGDWRNDPNKNEVFNVYFGMNSYKHLDHYMQPLRKLLLKFDKNAKKQELLNG